MQLCSNSTYSEWLSFRVKKVICCNVLVAPQICEPLSFYMILLCGTLWHSFFCSLLHILRRFFLFFPPSIPIIFFICCTLFLTFSPFFYTLYLLLIYLVFPLLLIIFTFCLRLLLYISSFYYSLLSSPTSPLLCSTPCCPVVSYPVRAQGHVQMDDVNNFLS